MSETLIGPALPAAMQSNVKAVAPTGSRFICTPAPTNTDEDWIILVENVDLFDASARSEGWSAPQKMHDAEKYPEGFDSYRKDEVNLIVTSSENFYRRFGAATYVARRLNLLVKADRIALFQAVLYGNKAEERP